MRITKFGHCCLLIEEQGMKFLVDPGAYSEFDRDIGGVDAVLITHEHGDHCHIATLKKILGAGQQTRVLTNSAVGALLKKEDVSYELVEDTHIARVGGVSVEGYGSRHAEIVPGAEVCVNTGYFVGERFFYPGDAFHDPGKKVEILALPVAGPWMKIADAVEYVKTLKPNFAFPVHDGMIRSDRRPGSIDKYPSQALLEWRGKYAIPPLGTAMEF